MKLLNKEIICYFDGYNIKDNYDTCVSSYQDDKSFSQNKFEILSEDEEIDIDSKVLSVIKKINWLCEGKNINEYSSVTVDLKDVKYLMEYIEMLEHKLENKYDSNFKKITDKYNELIKAVKQLNKQMKEK